MLIEFVTGVLVDVFPLFLELPNSANNQAWTLEEVLALSSEEQLTASLSKEARRTIETLRQTCRSL